MAAAKFFPSELLTRALEYYDAYLRSQQREDTEVAELLTKLKADGGSSA
jgi:hypothetical protein